jgi:hypothetical protein
MALASPLIELPEPDAKHISVQAVVMLPPLTGRERELLPVLVRAIPRATAEYTRSMILSQTGGTPATCTLMPDHVQLGVTVDPGDLSTAMAIVENLIFKAALRDEDITRGSEAPELEIWERVIAPEVSDAKDIKPVEVRDLYTRVFRPENTTLAVGGPIVSGEAQAKWKAFVDRWAVPRLLPRNVVPEAIKVRPGTSSLSVFEIDRPVRDVPPAELLALIALGSGKGSTLFRVARQKLGISYEAQAVLRPARVGFEEKVVVTTDVAAGELTQSLLDDVNGWTDRERLRALGMAEAISTNGSSFGPLYLRGTRPLTNSLEDRTFMAAYWQAKTGTAWQPDLVATQMRAVTLDELKQAALRILDNKPVVRQL